MEIKDKKIIIIGLETTYTDVGSGEAVLIMHGWAASSAYWKDISIMLAEKGFRAVALDLPGFGGTSAPNSVWSLNDYADFVDSFTGEIGLNRFHLLGHSFGGALAMKMSVREPGKISKLILCDAAAIRGERLNLRQKISKFLANIGSKLVSSTSPFYKIAEKLAYRFAGSYDY
ncbi:MAG: alpha/beta hydrolase, partial [Candidatus Pacebacteria bacterium]|nr:alpha/beta hydrolase [Candidatus Paceibacterota bacterium]